MTSNIGSQFIQDKLMHLNAQNRDMLLEEAQNQVSEMMKKVLPPEFLNRIDDIVMFKPLDENEIKEIVEIQLKNLIKHTFAMDIKLSYTKNAVNWIAKNSYEPQYGARPVKRLIQKTILNDLAKQILDGKVEKEKEIVIDVNNEGVFFRN
jgi:ATP-dependent Clp protease ATP-binding subunit ClpB